MSRPPRWAEWLVARVLPAETRETVLGDLHERYAARAQRSGRRAADRWYAAQALTFIATIPIDRARSAAAQLRPGNRLATGLLLDIRETTRALARERALTLAIVALFALTTGPATAVFTVVKGVLLEPLPYADPSSLVMLWDEYPDPSTEPDPKPVTRAHAQAWSERTDLFVSAGAFDLMPAGIDAGRWPDRVDAALVGASLLSTLGVEPLMGRLFTAEDDVPGAPPVVILSYELWQSAFGGDAAILGRRIDVDGESTEVIGVMPRGFWFYDPYAVTRSYVGASASAARLWRPLAGRFPGENDYPRYRMIARLRPGVTAEHAAAALATAERQLPLDASTADGRLRVVPLDRQITAAVRPRLIGLSAAVLLVVLIGSINVASLLAARLEARRTELSIRAALGAGRIRMVRGLVLHAAVLALGGAALGCVLADAGVNWLLTIVPRGVPLAHRVSLDSVAVAFAVTLALATALVVALGSALRLTRGGRWTVTSDRTIARTHSRLVRLVLASQVTFSVVLLISATVLVRSFLAVNASDPGFDRRDTITFQALRIIGAPGAPIDFSFFDRLEAEVARVPGVIAVGSGNIVPFSRWGSTASVGVAGAPERMRVSYRAVSPGYFDALQVEMRGGRSFNDADHPGAAAVAIVNDAFVDRYLRGRASPLGTSLVVARGREVERTIVGVVRNVKERQLHQADEPIIYVPFSQSPSPVRHYLVRAAMPPDVLADRVREAAARVDPKQPLQSVITLKALVDQTLEEERFYAATGSVLAGIAAVLALAGVYGIVSHGVRQRTRDIGVRLALGASPADVYRMVLVGGLLPVATGLVLGCLGAAAAVRLAASLIHATGADSGTSYAGAALAFAITAGVACLIPARRAARTDPSETLRAY